MEQFFFFAGLISILLCMYIVMCYLSFSEKSLKNMRHRLILILMICNLLEAMLSTVTVILHKDAAFVGMFVKVLCTLYTWMMITSDVALCLIALLTFMILKSPFKSDYYLQVLKDNEMYILPLIWFVPLIATVASTFNVPFGSEIGQCVLPSDPQWPRIVLKIAPKLLTCIVLSYCYFFSFLWLHSHQRNMKKLFQGESNYKKNKDDRRCPNCRLVIHTMQCQTCGYKRPIPKIKTQNDELEIEIEKPSNNNKQSSYKEYRILFFFASYSLLYLLVTIPELIVEISFILDQFPSEFIFVTHRTLSQLSGGLNAYFYGWNETIRDLYKSTFSSAELSYNFDREERFRAALLSRSAMLSPTVSTQRIPHGIFLDTNEYGIPGSPKTPITPERFDYTRNRF